MLSAISYKDLSTRPLSPSSVDSWRNKGLSRNAKWRATKEISLFRNIVVRKKTFQMHSYNHPLISIWPFMKGPPLDALARDPFGPFAPHVRGHRGRGLPQLQE